MIFNDKLLIILTICISYSNFIYLRDYYQAYSKELSKMEQSVMY